MNKRAIASVITIVAVLLIGTIAYRLSHPGSHFDRERDMYMAADDDKEMNEAIATAKRTVGEFRKIVTANRGLDFSVKVPVTDNGKTEHFWLEQTTITDFGFKGKIGNDAETVKNVKYGDPITVKTEDISDWLYLKDGKMEGNYTLRVEIGHMPKAEADGLRKRFKLDY